MSFPTVPPAATGRPGPRPLLPRLPRPPRGLRRLGAVVASHPVLDAYAGFVPAILGVLQVRCALTAWEAASLLSLGPLASGLSQPLFAWASDRVDSRLVGAAGLAVAAIALSSIGLADSFGTLLLLYGLGMLGVGAFHPVAAASVGQLAGRRRSAGVTCFFVAGMVGATLGPIISSRVTSIEPNGFTILQWLMIPGLLTAMVLHLAIRDVPHRTPHHRTMQFEPDDLRRRWWATGLLYAGNAMRFSVNIALFYLYVRWAESYVGEGSIEATAERIAALGSIYCGELNALTMAGMGLGGLAAGFLVRPGWEKRAFVLVPVLLAPAIALFPHASRAGTYAMALAGGVAFAAMIPSSISVAQRLLPHRTSLASGLMMGGAWAVATAAPPLAEWSLGVVGMKRTFLLVAALLAGSGAVGLLLPGRLLRAVVAIDDSGGEEGAARPAAS